jgi:hypothetical protein
VCRFSIRFEKIDDLGRIKEGMSFMGARQIISVKSLKFFGEIGNINLNPYFYV